MDTGGFEQGFQYSVLTFGDLELPITSSPQQLLPAQVPVMPATTPLLPANSATHTLGQAAGSGAMAEEHNVLSAGVMPAAPSSDPLHTNSLHAANFLMINNGTQDNLHSGAPAFMSSGSELQIATNSILMPSSSDLQPASALMPSEVHRTGGLMASSSLRTGSGLMAAAGGGVESLQTAGGHFLKGSTTSTSMPPPPSSSSSFWAQTPTASTSRGGDSFDDSGYFSPQFTSLRPRHSSSSEGQAVVSQTPAVSQTLGGHSTDNHGTGTMVVSLSPSRAPGRGGVAGNSTPRSHWAEDFASLGNMSDDWDCSFINNFEENLFSIEPQDMHNIMEGILNSPFKTSPSSSPFTSPRHGRQPLAATAAALADSPLSNVMLSAVKVSPGGVSPFRDLFSTPSPIKGSFNIHTRLSPKSRQRRRILQSPARHSSYIQKGDSLPDPLLDMPHFLTSKMDPSDDLGVTPFTRTNSMGFEPTSSLTASPPYDQSLAHSVQSLGFDEFLSPPPGGTPTSTITSTITSSTLQEISNTACQQPRPHKRPRMQALHHSPSKDAAAQPGSSGSHKSSPVRVPQRRISVTRHSHLVDKLDTKEALRFVRARFAEVLEKAVETADKKLEARLKACGKRLPPRPSPEVSVSTPLQGRLAAAVPSAGVDMSTAGVTCFTRIQPSRPPVATARRRQEILPKPTPDWPQRQPCKIAPKKRKR